MHCTGSWAPARYCGVLCDVTDNDRTSLPALLLLSVLLLVPSPLLLLRLGPWAHCWRSSPPLSDSAKDRWLVGVVRLEEGWSWCRVRRLWGSRPRIWIAILPLLPVRMAMAHSTCEHFNYDGFMNWRKQNGNKLIGMQFLNEILVFVEKLFLNSALGNELYGNIKLH